MKNNLSIDFVKNSEVVLSSRVNVILTAINTFILLLVYMPYMKTLYSFDSYEHMLNGGFYEEKHLVLGRPIAYIIQKGLEVLGLSVNSSQQIMKLFLVVAFAICVVIIINLCVIVIKRSKVIDIVLINALTLITFINIFIQEAFHFSESVVISGLGIICVTLAAYFFLKYDSIKSFILATLLLSVGLSAYQIFIQFFIVWTLGLLLISTSFSINKKFIIKFIKFFFICLISTIITMLPLMYMQNAGIVEKTNRDLTLSNLSENFKILFNVTQKEIWGINSSLAGSKIIILLFSVLLVLLVINLIKEKMKINQVISIIAVILICYCSIFFIHLLTGTVWAPPRTLLGFYCTFSMIGVIVLSINTQKATNLIIISLCFILMIFSSYHIDGYATAQRVTNAFDKEISKVVDSHVNAYEHSSGKKITKISVTEDKGIRWAYDSAETYASYDQSIRGWAVKWCVPYLFRYYSGRNLESIEMPDSVYNKYYADKNWSCFIPDEQIVFIDDTMYISLY